MKHPVFSYWIAVGIGAISGIVFVMSVTGLGF
jgi:hypothetical protein